MSTYSVADAKSGLPKLIDLALGGEEVVISRHGRPVAELRPLAIANRSVSANYDWLKARRQARKTSGLTSVELLDQLYNDPEG
jgi:antitoxin (DNA-binding transcriptional repressor) of toxin-antitoxin stability system